MSNGHRADFRTGSAKAVKGTIPTEIRNGLRDSFVHIDTVLLQQEACDILVADNGGPVERCETRHSRFAPCCDLVFVEPVQLACCPPGVMPLYIAE